MDSRIYILTHKRLTGQLSHVENEELLQLHLLPENKALSDEIAYVWNLSKNYFPSKDWQKESAKKAFMQRISAASEEESGAFINAKTRNWILLAIAIFLFGLLAIRFLTLPKFQQQVLSSIEYATILDGTKVWFGENAELVITEHTANSRRVSLKGEATFDVDYRATSPFVLDLGKGIFAEVIGTSFMARSTHSGESAVISVREGKVRLYKKNHKQEALLLGPGETGEIEPNRNIQSKTQLNTLADLSEDSMPLRFDETPLDKVFQQIGLRYQVDFDMDLASSSSCLYSGTFNIDADIDESINAMLNFYPKLTITRSERSTYIVSGECK